jgi:hypothetical protein
VSDSDRLADQILDLMVYAPIGLALEARELLPKLADRGRGQVALTRLAGKVAADRGQGEVRRVLEQVVEVVGTVLGADPRDPPGSRGESSDHLDPDRITPPIDGYDDLTAPQLLPHLPPLSDRELDEVLAYEQAHRSRATVINRIRQLQG